MKIREIRALWGPNYWSRYKVIYMKLDIGTLEDIPSNKVPGIKESMLKLIPTMMEHRCSPGCRGGFIQRVEEGTWAAHIVEHIAIELQCLAGMEVGFGKTRETNERGVYNVVFRYRDEDVGLEAGKKAVRIVEALFNNKPVKIAPIIDKLKDIRERAMYGPSTFSIVKEAEKKDIPVIRLNKHSYVQLGYGKYQRRIQATMVDSTSAIGVEIADDKEQTKEILIEAGIPVPRGEAVRSYEEAVDVASDVGYPVVVKPLVGHHGLGITPNIKNKKDLKVAFDNAKKLHEYVLVEKFLIGFDHRILVIDHKFIAAARREPASITGDGKTTIKKLINKANSDPRRGIGHENVLTRIEVDHQTKRLLKQAGLKMTDVLPKGKIFYLKSTANISTGGTAIDITDEVHPHVKKMAERISNIIDINIMGIDTVAPDLKVPLVKSGGGVVEVNAAPGFRMHLDPFEGTPRNVASHVIDMLFPPGVPTSIPIIAVTGTNGKTTTVRLISHILKYSGKKVGLCCTDGVEIENQVILKGDYSGPAGVKFVLKDPSVDHAVLEVARGGIIRRGLVFDESDVGVLLNVSSDHLGDGDINSLEELAELKSIVVETVKESGTAVLNCDDPRVVKYKDTIKASCILFSMDEKNIMLEQHVHDGGTAVTVKDGEIILKRGQLDLTVANINDIPITFEGIAKFNIANALAAVAATYAIGISVRNIQAGLVTFNPSTGQLPGRMNLIEVGNFKVLVDYGHNVSALTALKEVVDSFSTGRKINVAVGTGSRKDEDLIALGETLGMMYDHIYITDADPRRRKKGETADLVMKGLLSSGLPKKNVKIVIDERDAVKEALAFAKAGDLLVIQADDVQMCIRDVMEHKNKLRKLGKKSK